MRISIDYPKQQMTNQLHCNVSLRRMLTLGSLVVLTLNFILPASACTLVEPPQIDSATVQLIDGTTAVVTINAIDERGNLSGEGIRAGLNLADVLSLRTEREAVAEPKFDVTILTVGGGMLMARNPLVANDVVSFQSKSGVNELEVQAVRAIVWQNSRLIESTIKDPSKENDTIIAETAKGVKVVGGILESIDEEFLRVNYKGKSQKIAIGKIRALVSADLGMERSGGAVATIDLADQSKIVGTIQKLADGEMEIGVSGSTVKINSKNIVRINIVSDRLLYLSDAEPLEVQEKAVFSVQRSWKRDRSIANNPLQILLPDSESTVKFEKGIGTQSRSRLVFANSNEFDRFNAIAGIDAETKGRGDCQMVVRGDGIELWSQRVRGSDGPQQIDVDITGMREIELLVYPGEEFDLGDHANWADARFLKTK